MSRHQLLKKIELPRDDWIDWYNRQVLVARMLANGLRRRAGLEHGRARLASEIPQAEEIVSETVARVLDGCDRRYVNETETPFDKFFARCLRTTLSSLRASERSQIKGAAKLDPKLDLFKNPLPNNTEIIGTIHDDLSKEKAREILATAIANTRMSGKVNSYARQLVMYADYKYTTAEIADDLDVKESTVNTLRKRVRRAIGETNEEAED